MPCSRPLAARRRSHDATIMDRPERVAALDYLRRQGTESSAAKLSSSLRAAFRAFERKLEQVPEGMRTRRPTPNAWSVHEVVDHLVESDRPAIAELRALCAGVSPESGPIPARLNLEPLMTDLRRRTLH